MLSHQTREQDKPGSTVCRDACVGDLVVRVGMPQPQKEVSSSQELSPGTKEALILAGLLSEDQVCLSVIACWLSLTNNAAKPSR